MFFKNIHKRIKITLLIIFFIFIVIILRVFYIQVIDYKKLNKKASDLWNRNLPIWTTYEPGSTFKIITLATVLEEGKVNLEKDTYYDKETFMQVVENSCNPSFVILGQRLEKNTLFDYIDKFSFGKKGIYLNSESTGIIFDRSKVGPVELAITVFGQGVSVTPIHLAV